MDIHEYQAKDLLRGYGLPTVRGGVARSAGDAQSLARDLEASAYVVKAQVLAGGRGQAGGIRPAETPDAVGAAARALLGSTLITRQTGARGKPVAAVYVEERVAAAREVYLAVLVDRGAGRVAFLGSGQGGEDIEERAHDAPGSLHKMIVDPDAGFDREAAQAFARAIEIPDGAVELMAGLYRAFVELDASLIEINPLAVTEAGALVAVDIKMALDDNALFRHDALVGLRAEGDADPGEIEAARAEMNYVRLDGTIGCLVNGAGLALATLDLIHDAGGHPANFMDVRPGATRQQVAAGFDMILRDPTVAAILVNVCGGGILRCDTIAEGVAEAIAKRGLHVPLIVRFEGTNSEVARKTLADRGVRAAFAEDMADAAQRVAAAAAAGAGGA